MSWSPSIGPGPRADRVWDTTRTKQDEANREDGGAVANSTVKDLLGSTEIVLIDTRQHWMAAIRFALRPIVIGLIGLGLLALNSLFTFNDDQFLSFINDLITWVVVILFLVAVVWVPIDLIRWDSRHYVLTNRRAMRVEGVLRKTSIDSSIEQITDIGLVETTFGRLFGYADLTFFTASESANEDYRQLLDALQFKKAVLDAKEAIRVGAPLSELPSDFIVKGGTNEASMRADGKIQDEPEPEQPPAAAAVSSEPEPMAAEPAEAPVVEPAAAAPRPTAAAAPKPEPEPVAPEPVATAEPLGQPALVAEAEPEPEAPEPEPEPEPEAEKPEPEPEPQPEAEKPDKRDDSSAEPKSS